MLKKILIAALLFIMPCSLFIISYAQEQPEQITITTYYPSPYGSYDQLTTTGNTTLATNPGSVVGIGTTTPDEKLEVEWVTDGTDAEIGRGTTDTDITFIALRNASGAKCYIYPNATGDGIEVSTTKP